jgi:hypothetical protein
MMPGRKLFRSGGLEEASWRSRSSLAARVGA